jgi:hypothetical protein
VSRKPGVPDGGAVMILRLILLAWVLVVPAPAFADAVVADWIGEYAMNHDGLRGTLHIADTKAECAGPSWCHLRLSYVDQQGVRRAGTIARITDRNQHMTFVVSFPGYQQRFEAYLMSWDKTTMAGSTSWRGRTFGFYATKRRVAAPGSAEPGAADPAAQRAGSIDRDGMLQVVLPDGTRRLRRPGACGYTIIPPGGEPRQVACQQAPPATPPNPPDAVTSTWLIRHNDALLDIMRVYLDAPSIANYQANFEPGGVSIYNQIFTRTDVIHDLSRLR